MKIRPVVIIGILLITLMCFGLSLRAQAAPVQQQFATNTPGADGRILYKVQPGDFSCIRVALLNGISVEQLLQLNSTLKPDCSNLVVGTLLVIGTAGPAAASVTPGPSSIPATPTITPTPFAGSAEICVLIYNDLNGNGLRQAGEPAIPGGTINMTGANGNFSQTLDNTVSGDPNVYPGDCFSDVPEGNYRIVATLPDNYNATTSLDTTLDIKAGDRAFVPFGAKAGDSQAAQPAGQGNQDGGGTSPLLGIFGGLLLLGGLGFGWYALRLRGSQSNLKHGGLLKR